LCTFNAIDVLCAGEVNAPLQALETGGSALFIERHQLAVHEHRPLQRRAPAPQRLHD
jgi:hypothetical protein